MAGRARPNWIYFDGGPFHGKRMIVGTKTEGPTLTVYTPAATKGMRSPHEYRVTDDYRRGDMG
jgi:hypothetical protein